jgi:hypothetical protein
VSEDCEGISLQELPGSRCEPRLREDFHPVADTSWQPLLLSTRYWHSCAKTCLRANAIPAPHNDHRITDILSGPPNGREDTLEAECEHLHNDDSAHLSKRHRTSTFEDDILYSTSTSWDMVNLGIVAPILARHWQTL